MSLVNVEGYNNLMKDTSSGGIVNVDKRSYNDYLVSRNIAKQRNLEAESTRSSVESLQIEINNIKGDLNDIKALLMSIVNK
jgi:GMP synthase PP-ATPase subunit